MTRLLDARGRVEQLLQSVDTPRATNMAQAAIQTTDLATGKSMVLMHAALGVSQSRLEWCGYTSRRTRLARHESLRRKTRRRARVIKSNAQLADVWYLCVGVQNKLFGDGDQTLRGCDRYLDAYGYALSAKRQVHSLVVHWHTPLFLHIVS